MMGQLLPVLLIFVVTYVVCNIAEQKPDIFMRGELWTEVVYPHFNNSEQSQEIAPRGSRRCRRKLEGKCVKNRKDCPEDLPVGQQPGKPYCRSKKYRCCYNPEDKCTTNGGIYGTYDGAHYCILKNCSSWIETWAWCAEMGMALVEQPDDAIGLTDYVNSLDPCCCGCCGYWLGATGDGVNQVWLDGTIISNTDPLWWPGGLDVDEGFCTALVPCNGTDTPLATGNCTSACGYRLCKVE